VQPSKHRILYLLFLVSLSMGFMATSEIFFQNSSLAQTIKEITGQIVALDLGDSTLAVQAVSDEERGLAENLTFSITKDTTIKKGETNVSLSDIQIGAQVSVSYTSAIDGTNTAKSISVK